MPDTLDQQPSEGDEPARGVPIELTKLTKHYPGTEKPAVDAPRGERHFHGR